MNRNDAINLPIAHREAGDIIVVHARRKRRWQSFSEAGADDDPDRVPASLTFDPATRSAGSHSSNVCQVAETLFDWRAPSAPLAHPAADHLRSRAFQGQTAHPLNACLNTEEYMTPAARSMVYFGVYVFLTGTVLLIAPDLLLSLFGLGSTTDVWIRVLGCVVSALGAYYVTMGRAEATAFFRATLWGRAWIFVSFSGLVVIGMAKPPLVLFGIADLLGAVWTWRALKTAA
jgi:hypothetical protein